MVYIETCDDITDEMADQLGIYGEERSFFVANLAVRMREAVANEKRLYKMEPIHATSSVEMVTDKKRYDELKKRSEDYIK